MTRRPGDFQYSQAAYIHFSKRKSEGHCFGSVVMFHRGYFRGCSFVDLGSSRDDSLQREFANVSELCQAEYEADSMRSGTRTAACNAYRAHHMGRELVGEVARARIGESLVEIIRRKWPLGEPRHYTVLFDALPTAHEAGIVFRVDGSVDVFDVCLKKAKYKGKFEFTYVSLS